MAEITDVSPIRSRTQITIDRHHQSVSGKALCVAMSDSGERIYVGGHSGVWRSENGGSEWTHGVRPQPPQGSTAVSGALLPPAVYDLLILPSDPDVVFAATGRDSRRPVTNGVYRSTDAGDSWQLVQSFIRADGSVGTVASLAIAPDDERLMFAGGQFAVGLSTNAGLTWSETRPQANDSDSIWYVACGPAVGARRHLYAVGSHVWHSTDSGRTWVKDPGNISAGPPADGLGQCAQCLCVDPADPETIYVARNAGELWRGRFSTDGTTAARWTQLPAPPMNYPGTTASGTDFVMVHAAPDGQKNLIYSDRRSVHISIGEPASTSEWSRIDQSPIHVDPHGIAVSRNFAWASAGPAAGKIAMVNDGGAVVSSDGATTWDFGRGLSTLGLVNTAVLPRPGKRPGLLIGMGDNNAFFSADGGTNWRTQDYRGGDNDCAFTDPMAPHWLVVFAPRSGHREIFLYRANPGRIPDASWGTASRHAVPGPPPPPGESKSLWTAVSSFHFLGYRPLILTLKDESPRPDGDFITIVLSDDRSTARLLRTTAMSSIARDDDWLSTATREGQGTKVFRQGPVLPAADMTVVQASGGHDSPTFYVGNQGDGGGQSIWRWHRGLTTWEQVVPIRTGSAPTEAVRFFADPYRPEIIYVLAADHIYRTINAGGSWTVDAALELALTENGAFPMDLSTEAGTSQVLLRDMIFDPTNSQWRVAVGPAGIFQTLNGRSWNHLMLSSASAARPNNAVCDFVTDPDSRWLYVATSNRGVLRMKVPRPLITLSCVKISQEFLNLIPPINLRRDVFTSNSTERHSLKTRLLEIRGHHA